MHILYGIAIRTPQYSISKHTTTAYFLNPTLQPYWFIRELQKIIIFKCNLQDLQRTLLKTYFFCLEWVI